jgi:hypothetical protein
MNPERREQLNERRRELQKQIELDERRSLLDFQLRDLEARGVSCEIDYDTEPLVEWAFGRFPTTMHGISWPDVPGHRCEPYDDGILVLARELLASRDADEGDEVEILFSNGRAPALRIRFAEVLAHGPALASDFEVWLLCRGRGWLMEYISTRGWCWGRSPEEGAAPDNEDRPC